jgi:hypothetical protein
MPFPPHPPQQSSNRISRQQLLLSLPHPPLLLKKEPLEQQESKRMIQMMELHPHPLSLHPQLVAAKSLISDLHKNYLQYRLCENISGVTNFTQKNIIFITCKSAKITKTIDMNNELLYTFNQVIVTHIIKIMQRGGQKLWLVSTTVWLGLLSRTWAAGTTSSA